MVSGQHHDAEHLEILYDDQQGSLSPIQDERLAMLPPARDSSDSITVPAPTHLEQHPNTRENSSSASPDDTHSSNENVHLSVPSRSGNLHDSSSTLCADQIFIEKHHDAKNGSSDESDSTIDREQEDKIGFLSIQQNRNYGAESLISSGHSSDLEKQADRPGDSMPQRRHGFFVRQYRKLRAAYWPLEDPPLILPSPPTDIEKGLYLHTNRIPLYIIGIFAFLSLSAGMWLFTISASPFYWFGAFTFFVQLYLVISYWVGVWGKDFNIKAHEEVLQNYPLTAENAPSVDIYLPCCFEPLEVLENTYKYVKDLEYPGKVRVRVMDDGAQESVRELATSYGFDYSVRDDRPRLKKAGNLRWSFARTNGDFFAIFDADFCPRQDFLLEIIPEHLADENTAIVQTPQFFRSTKEQTWVEQGAGATQELFYRVVQVNRNRWGASICVGSNAVYRRSALEPVGGTAEIGFSEDVHTGFGAVDRGWKVKYLPLCLACGICPDNPRAFFSQQMRWCMGSTTLLTNPKFWTSNLTFMQKVCYSCGFLYYSAVAVSIFISPIPGILLLWIRPELFKYYNLAFAIPSIFYGAILFPLWAKGRYNFNVQHIMVIQSFAYLNAVKDRLFGRALLWAPSGDNKAHKSNKYRNMRILAWVWWFLVLGGMISAVSWRVLHGLHWYNALPLILLNSYNFFLVHPFLFYCG